MDTVLESGVTQEFFAAKTWRKSAAVARLVVLLDKPEPRRESAWSPIALGSELHLKKCGWDTGWQGPTICRSAQQSWAVDTIAICGRTRQKAKKKIGDRIGQLR